VVIGLLAHGWVDWRKLFSVRAVIAAQIAGAFLSFGPNAIGDAGRHP
jgi:hypothetical protein